MCVKPVVRFCDELLIEPLLAAAGFVASDKEDCLALRVEGESHAPLTIRRAEAQLFHIGVARIVERIYAGTPQLRPELLRGRAWARISVRTSRGSALNSGSNSFANFDVPSHSSLWYVIHMD